MTEAPWLTPEALTIVARIAGSHRRAFGRPLLAAHTEASEPRLLAQELFAAPTVVLAHDGADPGGDPGPRLIYANRAALRLWRRPWRAMVGMPSRLTAEPSERDDRARALTSLRQRHAIGDYSGIRIDSQGRRFRIRGARVWTLWSEPDAGDGGQPCGQAAAFSDWHWL
jgi:hypothetical protein